MIKRIKISMPSLAILFSCMLAVNAQGPIRPLAQEYVQVAYSSDSKNMPLYSPSILRLSSGRLVISYTEARKKDNEESDYQVLMTSDDAGKTWTKRAEQTVGLQGRVFEANGVLYYISPGAGLPVCKSTFKVS